MTIKISTGRGKGSKPFVGARVYLKNNQSIPKDVWTKIILTEENYDVGNNFNTTLRRFIAPVSGYYSIKGIIYWLATLSGLCASAIYVDGVMIALGRHCSYGAGISAIAVDSYYLAKDSYVELYGYQYLATTLNASSGSPNTYMAIYLISEA